MYLEFPDFIQKFIRSPIFSHHLFIYPSGDQYNSSSNQFSIHLVGLEGCAVANRFQTCTGEFLLSRQERCRRALRRPCFGRHLRLPPLRPLLFIVLCASSPSVCNRLRVIWFSIAQVRASLFGVRGPGGV